MLWSYNYFRSKYYLENNNWLSGAFQREQSWQYDNIPTALAPWQLLLPRFYRWNAPLCQLLNCLIHMFSSLFKLHVDLPIIILFNQITILQTQRQKCTHLDRMHVLYTGRCQNAKQTVWKTMLSIHFVNLCLLFSFIYFSKSVRFQASVWRAIMSPRTIQKCYYL